MAEPQNPEPAVEVKADDFIVFQRCPGVDALGAGCVMLGKVHLHMEMLRQWDNTLLRFGGRFNAFRAGTALSQKYVPTCVIFFCKSSRKFTSLGIRELMEKPLSPAFPVL